MRAARGRRAGVALVGGEEIQRHVAPVVASCGIELKDRHQFDGRDAELDEIGNLFDQAGKRAAIFLGRRRTRDRGVKPRTWSS